MPEEGFSFFEIQTPLENSTLYKPKGSPEARNHANFETPLNFSDPKWPTPQHLGGGSELW